MVRFLEADKRCAKAKSYQLYKNILLQFSIISEKLKISFKNKDNIKSIALLLAFRSLGEVIIKKLKLKD
jgi:hypothetical protein